MQWALWKRGQAPFGYGDKDEATVLDFGKDKDNKPITAYFVKQFEVDDVSGLDEITLGVLHDDGVIVYLNGSPLVRNNMPTGSVRPESLAPESRGEKVENDYWMKTIPAERLRAGINLIAAEVHQNEASSSDMGFDLEIVSDAVSPSEILEAVESGAAMKRLQDWKDRLPIDLVESVQAF